MANPYAYRCGQLHALIRSFLFGPLTQKDFFDAYLELGPVPTEAEMEAILESL